MNDLRKGSSLTWKLGTTLAAALGLIACGRGGSSSPDAAPSVSQDGAPDTSHPSFDVGALPDVGFNSPDAPSTYVPQAGHCGLDAPAFCDTFEAGPLGGGRSGELDPAHWSVVRGSPYNSSSFDDAFRVGPALIGDCRPGLSGTRVLPDADVLVCDPVPTIPTRHVLATAAAQNYGFATYRIRQPFDFAGRTGTIKLDLELSNNGLGGWPALILAEDPSAAPSFDWQERGSGPRNGLDIEFGTGWCNTPRTLEPIIYTFNDYVQSTFAPSFDCDIPHATTLPNGLNHVEIYVTQRHAEVWASDASPDGVTFPNFHRLWAGDVALPFSRGYVSLALRNHATIKYWLGSAATVRWDNVGFDGPVVTGWREFSAPDSLTAFQGLPGCNPGGNACQWVGDVIAASPGDGSKCVSTGCNAAGEGRNVGYVLPSVDVDKDEPPVALRFAAVAREDATRARLVLAAMYPWFSWNDVFPPPTHLELQFRVNGAAWHDRFISEVEAHAFTDFFPEIGGAGGGAGLLNQNIEVPLGELRDGDNVIELRAAGTWTGTYRVSVTGVDLVLDRP